MPDDVIAIECPHCRAVLKTRNAGMVGKKVNCPKCSEPFTAKAKTAPSRPVRDEDEEDAPPVRRKSARRRPEPEAVDPDDENDFLKGLNSAVRLSQREEAIEDEDDDESGAKKKRKKSAKKKSSAASDGPGVVWVVSGGIAAVIGAAIWAAIGYFTEHEMVTSRNMRSAGLPGESADWWALRSPPDRRASPDRRRESERR